MSYTPSTGGHCLPCTGCQSSRCCSRRTHIHGTSCETHSYAYSPLAVQKKISRQRLKPSARRRPRILFFKLHKQKTLVRWTSGPVPGPASPLFEATSSQIWFTLECRCLSFWHTLGVQLVPKSHGARSCTAQVCPSRSGVLSCSGQASFLLVHI